MDITKNGVPQYGYSNRKYTKTGQLISNEPPIVLDKNSPIIHFESDYVKSKIVPLFGGKVMPGEITEQEAALVDNLTFNIKCKNLFFDKTKDKTNPKISFNELKYFNQVIDLPINMFCYCKIGSIEFPKDINRFADSVFYGVVFDNLDFTIPDSVTSLGAGVFDGANLRSITGNNVIYIEGNIAQDLETLETVSLPKLEEVKISKNYPEGLDIFSYLPKLKSINLPELHKFNPITDTALFRECDVLEEVVCPKLQDLGIYVDNTTNKIKKLILGDKIDNVTSYKKEENVAIIPNIQFKFDKYVKIHNEQVFTLALTRYNNIRNCLPIPKPEHFIDLSDVVFSTPYFAIDNIPKQTNSAAIISTETFKSLPYTENTINTNLGFSEIHIVKSASKKINKFILGNSACLQKLFLETDIKEIDDLAFKYCPSLKEVHLNQELEKIGSFAFALYAAMYPALWALPEDKVHYLQLFNIPKNVNNIGDNPLLGQEQLTKTTLTLDPENKNFILENGILYNKNKTKIILATCDVQIDRIPDTVTEIGAGAFAFNKYTGELTIPSTVKKIGYLAFTYSKFQSIKFEDSINNIIFEKTGNNILYVFNTFQNVTLSNFYGMDNPSFYVEGRNASKQELNILKLNANIDQSNYIRVSLPNTLYSEDFDLLVPIGIKAYTYKKQGDTYVKSKTYEEGKVIPKGEAVTLEGEQGEYIFPIIKNQAVDKDKDNVLIGTDKDIEGNGNYYIFNNGSIELSRESNIIKENTVYIKKD